MVALFHIHLLHPCLSHCGDEVVSIATIEELGVGALAGGEWWSALHKPPSFRSLSLWQRTCVLEKPADFGAVSEICVLPLHDKKNMALCQGQSALTP